MKMYRWLNNPGKLQFFMFVMSTTILVHSVLNLVLQEKITSILFIILAGCLCILTLLNRNAYRMHTKMVEDIRFIQKEYDRNTSKYPIPLTRLNVKQRRLWEFIVSDYSPEELQCLFSLSPGGLAEEIRHLFKILELHREEVSNGFNAN
jgi:hypothetical protein